MKLYYSPAACSLSPHIVLTELGMTFETEKVSLKDKKTASGKDFTAINPKGYVPVLELDDGTVLTEGVAIIQYLADKNSDRRLAPVNGTIERYKLIEWLNFISTEVHKGFSPLFHGKAEDPYIVAVRDRLHKRLGYINKELSNRSYLMGEMFTIADAYLFTVLNWAKNLNVDLSDAPALQSYITRVAARPTVRTAMMAEGLIKE